METQAGKNHIEVLLQTGWIYEWVYFPFSSLDETWQDDGSSVLTGNVSGYVCSRDVPLRMFT